MTGSYVIPTIVTLAMTDSPGTWWILSSDILTNVLTRAHGGEDPDMLYLELAAMCKTAIVEDDDE